MATSPPPFNPFGGLAPQRGEKSTFSQRFDAFITWFIAAVVQLAALAANVYANAVEAFQSAATASSAAATALATANAYPWVSGATVQQYACVISPLDGRTYRRIAATGSGTTDPSLDTTGTIYVVLSAQLSAYQLVTSPITISAAVASIDFSTLFSSDYDKYVVELEGVVATGSVLFQFSVGGSPDGSTSYNAIATPGATYSLTTSCLLFPLTTSAGVSATIEMRNVNGGSKVKSIGMRGHGGQGGSSGLGPILGEGSYSGVSSPTGFRLSCSGGSFTSGKILIYGVRNKQ